MNNDEFGRYGEFDISLSTFINMKFAALKRALFICRTPNRDEYLEMWNLFDEAWVDDAQFQLLALEDSHSNSPKFKATVERFIFEWMSQEGFPDAFLERISKSPRESFLMYEFSCAFPEKITSLYIHYRDDLALISVENPWFGTDDHGPDPNDEWKEG